MVELMKIALNHFAPLPALHDNDVSLGDRLPDRAGAKLNPAQIYYICARETRDDDLPQVIPVLLPSPADRPSGAIDSFDLQCTRIFFRIPQNA